MAESLWGQLPTGDNIRTPASILLEQANALTEQTKGILVGKVVKETLGERFTNRLGIIAPALNNYTYVVLQADHSISMYPVTVNATSIATVYNAPNEEQFIHVLRTVLSSEEVRRVVAGLLAQIRAESVVG